MSTGPKRVIRNHCSESGPFGRNDLKEFPADVRHVVGFALWQVQLGRKHRDAKVLKGVRRAGVLEVVEDHNGDTFRAVYTVKFAGCVYVLHVFQKKSKKGIKTPAAEIELIRTAA